MCYDISQPLELHLKDKSGGYGAIYQARFLKF